MRALNAHRGRPIKDVTVDWDRFVPPVMPVVEVTVHWERQGTPVGATRDSPKGDAAARAYRAARVHG